MLADKLLSIQSHVASGHVGNSAAAFPLLLLGWDAEFVNTVQFSNHTGYARWGGIRFDATHLEDIFSNMRRNGLLRHARMLTGYTPSPEALTCVKELVTELRKNNPELVYLLDPVMGDMGRGMYVNPDVLPIYRSMLPLATVICPNQFEAQVLTDMEITSLESLRSVLRKLHKDHQVENVVVTSVALPDADVAHLGISNTLPNGEPAMLLVGSRARPDNEPEMWYLQFPELGNYFVGVGDTFAALTLARFTEGTQIPDAAHACGEQVPESPSECTLPIAWAVALAVASLQAILHRTLDFMKTHAEPGIDPFGDSNDLDIEDNVKVMRLRELRIVQSANDILHPTVRYRPQWVPN
ncbi:pyridoxal kinase [Malassezia cuniculi]|uniref:pyridoxal kinase n=1 Tax=Malassezia cuniculi TaxID=948313 RepID=A0AAF0J9Z4_9BASI|nr:pyridoxal kinase [Malassezia cuniculi]